MPLSPSLKDLWPAQSRRIDCYLQAQAPVCELYRTRNQLETKGLSDFVPYAQEPGPSYLQRG